MRVDKAIEFLQICALDYEGQRVEEIYNEIIELLNLVDEDCDTPDRLERGEKFEQMWGDLEEWLGDIYEHEIHLQFVLDKIGNIKQKYFKE